MAIRNLLGAFERVGLEFRGGNPLECALGADLRGQLELAAGSDAGGPGFLPEGVLDVDPGLQPVVHSLERDVLGANVLGLLGYPGAHAAAPPERDWSAAAKGPEAVLANPELDDSFN